VKPLLNQQHQQQTQLSERSSEGKSVRHWSLQPQPLRELQQPGAEAVAESDVTELMQMQRPQMAQWHQQSERPS